MRVMHVVPLVTPDGAYGGPVTVALNQLTELASRGHDVELVAGARGHDELPGRLGEVPARLFEASHYVPKLGYAGIASGRLLAYVYARARHVDLVHVHVARDLLTMPAARIAAQRGAPLVLQPHGMIDGSHRRSACVFDHLLTRTVFSRAQQVLTLTDVEDEGLAGLGLLPREATRIPNGIATPVDRATEPAGGRREVLFLARLHERKRPGHFVAMAGALAERFPDVDFRLIGPDEGEAASVQATIASLGLGGRLRWQGAVSPEEARAALAAATVYVLPSVNEVFPMTVLEAMSSGTAVVMTTSNGLAQTLGDAGAAVVTDESVDGLIGAVGDLLEDDGARLAVGSAGRDFVRGHWSMERVGDELEAAYARAVNGRATA